MSLICVACRKVIVMSNNLDHYGCCAACGQTGLTPEQEKEIEDSSLSFRRAVANDEDIIPVVLPNGKHGWTQ